MPSEEDWKMPKVIMNLVVNHTSDQHEWFQKRRQRKCRSHYRYAVFLVNENYREINGSAADNAQNSRRNIYEKLDFDFYGASVPYRLRPDGRNRR